MKRSKFVVMLLVVGLIAGSAQANIVSNGDFEADLALVPNPGDTDTSAPTGWEYDRYYSYEVDPWLMNVSAVGDGSGGNVGVVFGTWNGDSAWDPVVATYPDGVIEAGQYTLEITMASTGGAGEGWLDVQLGWFENPEDQWSNYAEYVREWIDVSLFGDGIWETVTWNFEVPADDPGIGMNWYHWLRGQSYNDYVIVGDVNLVPEPTTICLLGLGSLALLRRRRT
ncbi:MAG: PEP-CTERM sorting domain-containing protein [Planctomycetota bacterium]